MSLYKDYIKKKNFWHNTDNWLEQSNDEKYVQLKKNFLETIIVMKNSSDLPINALDDIDCLACLLNTHMIKSSILLRKINYSHLLKNKEYLYHVINTGIIDNEVCQNLLSKSISLKNNPDLARKILLERKDYFYFNYFKNLLKNESFALSLFENKRFNNNFVLISLPFHKKISQLLLERQSYPTKTTDEHNISYNIDILQDVKFLSKIIRKPTGHTLYSYLNDCVRKNKNICLCMLKYHPEYDIENAELKTLKTFKSCSKYWLYYNDFISQIKYFGSLFDNEDNLLEALKCLTKVKMVSRFNPNKNSFQQHCFIQFLQSSKSVLIQEFLKTEKGTYLLSLVNQSSADLNTIDTWLSEEFMFILNKIKLYQKMRHLPSLKHDKKLKI